MSIKRAVFDNFESDFAAAEVSEGYNDWFPEDGTYEALITSIVQVDCPFKEKDGTGHDGTGHHAGWCRPAQWKPCGPLSKPQGYEI